MAGILLRKLVLIPLAYVALQVAIDNREVIIAQIKKLLAWVRSKFSNSENIPITVVLEDDTEFFEGFEEEVSDFYCPISHEIMMDPVFTPYGHFFEKESIEQWL